jgi:DNA-directed RNA polymerase subunit L
LKLRISNIPVWGINNNVETLFNYNNETDQNNNCDIATFEQLTMYINFKNKTADVFNVTTEHAKFYYKGKQIKSPYIVDIPIVKLRENQEIAFTAITNIDTEENSTKYSPVSIAIYNEISHNEFKFIIESKGQLVEKQIVYIAIVNIIKKLENLIIFANKIDSNEKKGFIVINDENHTMGNFISDKLQEHKDILFASYNMPHPLENIINIHYSIKNNNNIKNIFIETINHCINLMTKIQTKIQTHI